MKRQIIPENSYTTYSELPLVPGDVRAYEIIFDLGSSFDNATFKVVAKRADGVLVEDIGTVDSSGIARYTLANNMYCVPGELVVRLCVLHDNSSLTDREIVFNVADAGQSTTAPETTITLTDGVMIKITAIESALNQKADTQNVYTKEQSDTRLFSKVDKIEGKGLSTNDFTNEDKQKLAGIETGAEVNTVTKVAGKTGEVELEKADVGLSNVDNTSDLDKPISTATQEALNRKADKTDIANIYEFKGSVNTSNELPDKYSGFTVNGNPTANGEDIGTFDSRSNTATFTLPANDTGIPDIIEVIIPVNEKKIPAGLYNGESFRRSINSSFGGYTFADFVYINENKLEAWIYPTEINTEFSASYIKLGMITLENTPVTVTLNLAEIYVLVYELNSGVETSHIHTLEAGDVYNCVDTGANYAWTGYEWDALGGDHKDLEAREMIGDIETALDDIIEIQNSLIGGDSK